METDVTLPKGTYQPGEHFFSRAVCTYRRSGVFFEDDGARIDLICRRTWDGPEPGLFEDFRIVVNDGRLLQYFSPNGRKRDRVEMSSKPRTQLLPFIGDAASGLGPADGYINDMGWNHICRSALMAPDLQLQSDTRVDGRLCRVVKCSTLFGALELTIDAETGAIASCKIHKSPNDLCGSVEGVTWPLKQWQPFGPDDPVVSYDQELSDVSFSLIAGTPVATNWSVTLRVAATSGREFVQINKTRRTSTRIDPDWELVDGAFEFDADDGALVTNLDFRDSGITLVWKDRTVTLASAAFNAPTALDFPEKPSLLWRLLVINGGLMLVIGVGWWFRRRQLERRK